MGLWPAKGDENAFCPRPLSHGSAALTFVISTEAQRSGEISVLTPLPGNVFRPSEAKPICPACPGLPWGVPRRDLQPHFSLANSRICAGRNL
jgi:hypothetical protein